MPQNILERDISETINLNAVHENMNDLINKIKIQLLDEFEKNNEINEFIINNKERIIKTVKECIKLFFPLMNLEGICENIDKLYEVANEENS